MLLKSMHAGALRPFAQVRRRWMAAVGSRMGRRSSARSLHMAVEPEFFRIDSMSLRVFHLVVHVLRILRGTIGPAATHMADLIAGLDMLTDLHGLGLRVKDLVAVSVGVTDLDGSVLATHEGHFASDRRVDRWVREVHTGLAAFIIEVGSTMGTLRTHL